MKTGTSTEAYLISGQAYLEVRSIFTLHNFGPWYGYLALVHVKLKEWNFYFLCVKLKQISFSKKVKANLSNGSLDIKWNT